MVIGEHGENMLPLIRFSSVGGIPLNEFISKEKTIEVLENTKKIAADIIALKGATVYAPGNGVATMIEAVIKDKKSVIPASTLLQGEYGADNVCIGVPTVIGANGVEKIIELKLDSYEQNVFNEGINSLKEAIKSLPL
jgi:malate dehydrogenase